MKPGSSLVAVVCALACATVAQADEDRCSDPIFEETYACREVVVEFDFDVFDWEAVTNRYGLTPIGIIWQLSQAWFEAPNGTDVPALVDDLKQEAGVIEVERNGEFVPPECRQRNVDIVELGTGAGAQYLRQQALDALLPPAIAGLGEGVVVAVLDTGVAFDHPALAGALTGPAIDLVRGVNPPGDDVGNGVDEDGDGDVDGGWGHGTAVAGLIHLVAPEAKILPVRILDDECRGTAFDFARGIVLAVEAGADVLNLSFGSAEGSDVVEDALEWAEERDVAIVAAAGNRGRDRILFPAKEGGAIGVAAVDELLVAASWTDHSERVDLAAPGVAVVVPYRGSYWRRDGTSFAAALVSGAFAVGRSVNPFVEIQHLREDIEETAREVGSMNPGIPEELGHGVPDLTALVERLSDPRRPHGARPARSQATSQAHRRRGEVAGPDLEASVGGGRGPLASTP